MADISSITLPGGGTYDLKDKNAASAVTSLNNRYTDNKPWISNSDANDYKTSGMYAMATGNANIPMSWGILFVVAPRYDTVEQEYRYSNSVWRREYRNNTWSQWVQQVKPGAIAYLETGTTATRNYTAGQYICWNGLLYTADTAIASGTTFYTSGGNKNLTECMGGGFNQLDGIRMKFIPDVQFTFLNSQLSSIAISSVDSTLSIAKAIIGLMTTRGNCVEISLNSSKTYVTAYLPQGAVNTTLGVNLIVFY